MRGARIRIPVKMGCVLLPKPYVKRVPKLPIFRGFGNYDSDKILLEFSFRQILPENSNSPTYKYSVGQKPRPKYNNTLSNSTK